MQAALIPAAAVLHELRRALLAPIWRLHKGAVAPAQAAALEAGWLLPVAAEPRRLALSDAGQAALAAAAKADPAAYLGGWWRQPATPPTAPDPPALPPRGWGTNDSKETHMTTEREMIETLAADTGCNTARAKTALRRLFGAIAETVAGDPAGIRLPGIGTLRRVARAAGTARNLAKGGAPVAYASGYRATFTQAKPLKARLAALPPPFKAAAE